ncbi:hypothetical protein I6A60_37705 [Frankia sp. AgB1.9]|nr:MULTISPECIES: hypothetical protein [unclassified Frankia]MBL7494396.1 hypothetical protein [Frankia sp. AgW1.1]MBL7553534.1 hypothetical protein [Frankia sp. AgB1.9]MBL7622465.1 hypothetical protein [Frankia sp. AgB1.8]
MNDLVELCRSQVGTNLLHHVGHFVDGEATFSVDAFDDGTLLAGLADPPLDVDRLRHDLITLGRRLNYELAEMTRVLTAARTGRLTRTILELKDAGVYWYWIQGNEYFVGLALGKDRVVPADAAMATIAEKTIEYDGLAPRSYGELVEHPAPADAPTPDTGPQRERRSLRAPDSVRPVVSRCMAELDLADLHFVGHFDQGSWQFSVDVLDGLAPVVFGGLSSMHCRTQYERTGQLLQSVAGQLDWLMTTTAGQSPGRPERLVLDVESGAFYFHMLGGGRQLLGVTLFQTRVSEAAQRMTRLARNLRVNGGSAGKSAVA